MKRNAEAGNFQFLESDGEPTPDVLENRTDGSYGTYGLQQLHIYSFAFLGDLGGECSSFVLFRVFRGFLPCFRGD
jgi:hypothetical protein